MKMDDIWKTKQNIGAFDVQLGQIELNGYLINNFNYYQFYFVHI